MKVSIQCVSLILNFLLFNAATPAVSAGEAAADTLFSEPATWPYHVSLAEPFAHEGGTLKAGQRGVLIRMETAGELIIDFGRQGVARVPTALTDILQQSRRIAAGEERKEHPNYVLQIGPRLVVSHGGVMGNHDITRMRDRAAILTVLCGDGEAVLAAIAEALADSAALLEEGKVFPLIIPVGVGDDRAFAEKLDTAGITCPFVYSHLAAFYTNSLQHDTSRLPLLVLTDLDGKVLAKRAVDRLTELKGLVPGLLELSAEAN